MDSAEIKQLKREIKQLQQNVERLRAERDLLRIQVQATAADSKDELTMTESQLMTTPVVRGLIPKRKAKRPEPPGQSADSAPPK